MNKEETLKALRHLKVETGSLACLGCGRENSCSTRGCAVIRAAIEVLEGAQTTDDCITIDWFIPPVHVDEKIPAETVIEGLHMFPAVDMQESKQRWIPCSERLPKEKQRVIVRCATVGTTVGWILWGRWMTDIGPHAGDVTHWMPLPAPPDKDNHVPAKAPNEPLTVEQLRGTPHGKIKDKTLQHICDRANELAYAYPTAHIGREKWEPCDVCSNAKHIVGLALAIMDDGSDHRVDTKMNCEYSFCPNCGRPLTDEAWAELERRVCGEV